MLKSTLQIKILTISTIVLIGLGVSIYIILNNKNNDVNIPNMNLLYNNQDYKSGNLNPGRNDNKYDNFKQRNLLKSGINRGINNRNKHQCFEDFRNIAIQKNNNLKRMEEHLNQIIKLSDKVNYDSSKLKFYKQQIIQHKKQYYKIKQNGSISQEDFFEQRLKRRQLNEDMKQIGSGINQEFNNLQLYLKDNFISGVQN